MLIGYRTPSCSNSESEIMRPSIILSALAALMAISVPAAAQDERFDWQRADRNYQDLLRGDGRSRSGEINVDWLWTMDCGVRIS